MSLRAKCAIAGLGATRMGKNYDHPNALVHCDAMGDRVNIIKNVSS